MIVLDELLEDIDTVGFILHSGTSLDDVRQVMSTKDIDAVVMGAGIPLQIRQEIVEHVFEFSKSTSLHMKDWNSGPKGMLPFVALVLDGLR